MGLNQGPGFSPNVGALIGPGGGAVPSTRTITTTAPLTIDGGASADLSANRTIAVDTAGSLSIGRLLATTNGSAAAPTVLIEPAGNSGAYWDATKGVVTSVDAVDRILARVNGTVELSTGAGISAGVPALRLVRDTADIQVFLTGSSPEAAITGQIGDLDVAVTGGFLFIKRSGVGNTGWALIDRCESGTYTPTATIVTNLDSVTPQQGTYLRVGNMVYVAIRINVDPTAAGNVEYRFTLPIASALTSANQLVGTLVDSAAGRGFVGGDATNDAALVTGTNGGTTAYTQYLNFGYEVI
jgi:hypothetical protein